ncbi:MPN527 family putative ECF transporter permease subunit [Malacoplasma muris]|uniref:MPN527 family putative ECF transporter permease subunit n=1 Tax=Malacoplasma muris TaxID=2119 RepID=UPI00398E4AD9
MEKNSFNTSNSNITQNKISEKTKQIRAMAITSCFLAISILVSFATNYIKITFLGDFLTLDLSLVFIVPIIFICNIFWALFAGIVCGLAAFIWMGTGLWVGPIFIIVINVIIILLVYLWYFIIFKKIKKTSIKLSLTLLITLILLMFLGSLLNGLIFTPLYWWIYNVIPIPSFIEAEKWYQSQGPNPYLIYINTYWNGIFGLYSAFNLLKFGVIFIIIYGPLLLIINNNIADRYFYRTNKKNP